MKSRTRYALIGLWFVLFLAAAPLIYLFVTGTKWDAQNRRFIKTGIISAPTSPRGAKLYLNGKLADTTPATVRFVTPGDYDIRITKPGYFDWNKRLAVRPQYATSVIQNLDTLYLFRSDNQRLHLRDGVINFDANSERILYVTPDTVFLADAATPNNVQELALPHSFNNIQIVASADNSYYLLYNQNSYVVFSPTENKLFDVSKQLATYLPESLQFSADGSLYGITGNSQRILDQINWRSQQIMPIASNVSGYTVSGAGTYYVQLQPDGASSSLQLLQAPNNRVVTLLNSAPAWHSSKIFLTNQNQIFILGDGTLYAVSSPLKTIAEFVTDVKLYDNSAELMFATNNEVDLYDYYSGSVTLVTRSSKEISEAAAVPAIGWVFFINDGRMQNIETDNRDHQNNYTFAAAGPGAKFDVNGDGSQLLLLSNGSLDELQLR